MQNRKWEPVQERRKVRSKDAMVGTEFGQCEVQRGTSPGRDAEGCWKWWGVKLDKFKRGLDYGLDRPAAV